MAPEQINNLDLAVQAVPGQKALAGPASPAPLVMHKEGIHTCRGSLVEVPASGPTIVSAALETQDAAGKPNICLNICLTPACSAQRH
jgi:hypothetical protein